MRALLISAVLLMASTAAALAEPISAAILLAVGGPALAANTVALAITTIALSTAPVGRGFFVKGRRP